MSLLRRLRPLAIAAGITPLVLSAQSPAAAPATAASRSLAALLDTVMFAMRTTATSPDVAPSPFPERLPEVTRAAWADDAARWGRVLAAARALNERALDDQERVTRRLVIWEAALQARRAPFWWVDFSAVTPYASPIGSHARALGARPLAVVADTGSYLRLLREVGPLMDSIRAGLEQRAARGIRLSRHALPASVALARAYTAAGSANPFAVPPKRLERLDDGTRAAFADAAAREVSQAIAPAAARLVALLEGPYAAAAPDAVGVAAYPGGRAYYDWLVQWHTTLPVTPAEVHRIGLAEVARIERDMEAIRAALGFTGTREAFHAQLARDPRFFATTPEEFGQRLMTYAERLRPLLPRAFGRFPAAAGDVRRLAPELEPAMTFGFYEPPSAADPIGHYFYNGTKLEERSLLTAAPLIAHELWPGHHFQVALARENPALPPYRRDRYYTAFGEGWGDYASIVAGDLGLYADPYERYGRLAMDLFISCRLVVDTGMNGLGWSLERGRRYMRAHVLESEAQILTESLRYSTDLPGQALAYKMGSREFVRLRAQARRTMAAGFRLPAFHDALLADGMLPMEVVRARVAERARRR
jgi:uncharacterized protein (DUF885 family)